SAIKNNEIGILKYWIPPHDAFPSPSTSPPTTAFGIAYLISLCLMAEIKRYIASKPKNNPRGSDLNHPRLPLWIIAGETANNNAANIPADVPPITLTRAKIIIVVRE